MPHRARFGAVITLTIVTAENCLIIVCNIAVIIKGTETQPYRAAGTRHNGPSRRLATVQAGDSFG